jgi:hypothetical protein
VHTTIGTDQDKAINTSINHCIRAIGDNFIFNPRMIVETKNLSNIVMLISSSLYIGAIFEELLMDKR